MKNMLIEVGKMTNIGILDLQGGVGEHYNTILKIDNVLPIRIKKKEQLKSIDGLIIPGGESTTLMKLIKLYDFENDILEFSRKKQIWGTCAGLIVSSKEYLNLIDIEVKRNAFGRQSSSFIKKDIIPEISNNQIEMIFIRAPIIKNCGNDVRILKKIEGNIIAAESKNILVTSFHPELTDQIYVHNYFIKKIKKSKSIKTS